MEHLGFDHTIQRRAGRHERPRQVLEDVARLALDVRPIERKRRIEARLARDAGLEIAGELAGGKDEIAGDDRLGVVRQRARALGSHHASRGPRHRGGQVDLDQAAGNQQAAGADRRPRRRRREEFTPHLVESVEVREVGEKYLRLHDVIQ